MVVNVGYRKYHIWRFEYWVVFFGTIEPEGRRKLKGGWYFRTTKKSFIPSMGSIFRCNITNKEILYLTKEFN